MAYEIRENSGSLFREEDPVRAEKSEYSGKVNIVCPHCNKGALHWINGWVKMTKEGKKFFSFSFKAIAQRPPKPEPRQQGWSDELDDECPF